MMGQMNLTMTIKKAELLDVLKKNRDGHHKIFLEAVEGYKKEMIKHLLGMLRNVRKGKRVHHMISLPLPEDHTDDYDTAIKMVSMHTGDTFELDAQTFSMFVEDRWEWKRNWELSNSRYSQTLCNSVRITTDDE